MKLSKNLGRVATTFLATAMLASLTAVPAFAATEGTKNEDGSVNFTNPASTATIDITKTIEKPAHMYMPDATFNFSVASYEGMENVGADAVTMTDSTISSEPKETDINQSSVTISGDVAIVKVDASKFEEPGEYEFTIQEAAGTYENGQSWTAQDLKLKVWITEETVQDSEGGGTHTEKQVYGYSLYKEDAADKKLTGFTNTYFGGNTNPTDNSFELSKVVAGNFATTADETTKHFTFNVSIANNALLGEEGTEDDLSKWYKVTVEHTSNCNHATQGIVDITYIEANANDASQIKLANGDKVTIDGLTGNETITVNEQKYTTDGFEKVSYKLDANEAVDNEYQMNTTGAADHKVTFTNTKSNTNPTGIVMDIAPYVLLVVVAAAGCFVFMRKRRED